MFETLSDRLGTIFDKLGRKGKLSARDIDDALAEIRIALLDADVSLEVVKDIEERFKERAIGEEVTRSVTPSQELVKRMNDLLIEVMTATSGKDSHSLLLSGKEVPQTVVMLGLQGSGKTTTTAKLAKWLKSTQRKKVLMASCDIYRAGAKEQLRILGEKVGVDVLQEIADEKPQKTAKRAYGEAKLGGYDHLLLDTAGRLTIDDALMIEIEQLVSVVKSGVKILVADALSGQDAARTALSFHERVQLDGAILTRIDGDSRGGAALSVSAVSGCGILFVGSGEGVEKLEAFDATRIASRILGMGDVVSLVERAREVVSEDDNNKMLAKMAKGSFDLDDFALQLQQLQKMGSLSSLLGMIPGMSKVIKGRIGDDDANAKMMRRQLGIIRGMTKAERADPRVLHASRKKRIAKGSGVDVSEVNKLLKQHLMMSKMMKKVGPGLQQEMMKSTAGGASDGEIGGKKGGASLPPSLVGKGMMGAGGSPSVDELSKMLGLGSDKRRF